MTAPDSWVAAHQVVRPPYDPATDLAEARNVTGHVLRLDVDGGMSCWCHGIPVLELLGGAAK